jgi:hypothetical protein
MLERAKFLPCFFIAFSSVHLNEAREIGEEPIVRNGIISSG